ncbi:hypothetical protein [Pseudonocardia asaccharolytica]|uniref:Glutathionylspermidine synthase pre-ATP-grasp-like domain-containing protein n=1 Tax=Pseudonocardia asaccharolytica DSM 44247 = NBRC 16224 TaxID=1123024 RepID=A0A511D661_9PSEU|nr:hypothetical protein [Pseudonocardia asaccharolytica]GEL20265.1 hypothetical protein PA7_41020 [Pseudonocardia asaccharolytica DSM 44247 = NBRC 16224]
MSARANRVTEAYLAKCTAPDSRLRHALADLDVSQTKRAAWPRLLPRPVMVDEAEFRAFGRDLVTIYELVTSLPQRCFDGDFERFRAALGIDDRRGALMRRLLGDGPPPLYGRADMYYDGSSFKLLEFNIGSALGGLDMVGTLPKAYLRIPAFAEFAAAHGLRYLDMGGDLAEALRDAGKAIGAGEPVVAVLEGPGGMAVYGHQRRAIAQLLAEQGIDCRVGEIGDLTFRAGKPHLDGTGVDVILRYYALEEMLAHPDGDALMEPVFRAHENGTVVVWTPSNVFGNKGTLAMLSECSADTSVFSAQERAVIDRVLPWSRMLGRRGAGSDERFIEECVQRREQLVFKPTGRFGGEGVLIGPEVDDRTWREALAASAQTGCLVQEIVRPNLELVIDPETGARSEWYALWAAFMTPAGLSGGGVRAVPPGGTTVITMINNTKVRNTCLFTC